jgi:hypothetical protein
MPISESVKKKDRWTSLLQSRTQTQGYKDWTGRNKQTPWHA